MFQVAAHQWACSILTAKFKMKTNIFFLFSKAIMLADKSIFLKCIYPSPYKKTITFDSTTGWRWIVMLLAAMPQKMLAYFE